MKKLNQLKLNQLSKVELEKREMNFLFGGDCQQCACGCDVADTYSNGGSNASYGYTYSAGWGEGGNDTCACSGPAGSNCVSGAGTGYAL